MAVKIKRISKAPDNMDMSSISDIVFLLLIYFMVVTVFQQDIGMPFVLPGPDTDEPIVKIKESNVADLSIDANNVVFLDDVPIRTSAIQRELQLRLRANPKLVVILSSHPMSDYGTFADVLDEVRLADVRRMAIKMAGG